MNTIKYDFEQHNSRRAKIKRFLSTGRLRWVLLALIILALVAAAILSSGKKSESKDGNAASSSAAGSSAQAALSVEVVQAGTEQWQSELQADGTIQAWQTASISAQGSGLKISKVLAQVGDTVRAGQTLVEFESSTALADINQLNAVYKEAQANLSDAQMNFSKADALRAAGAISEVQYRQFKTGLISAQARLEAARASSAAGKTRVSLTAPSNGVISTRNATVGTVVQPGQELYRMLVDNRLEWQAELTAEQMTQVKVGNQTQINLPDGTSIHGTVRSIAPVINPASNTATAYVKLDGASNVRAGMSAKGVFIQPSAGVMTVPQTATMIRDGFYYVFKVIEKDNAAPMVQQAKVSLGARKDGKVAILSGINANDKIVAAGVEFLKDGDAVKIVNASAPTTTQTKP